MAITEYLNDKTFAVEGSPFELLAVLEDAYVEEGSPNRGIHQKSGARLRSGSRADFYGGVNDVGVRELVTGGWAEGLARLTALTEELSAEMPKPASIRRKMRWTDEGDEIDMQRVYGGQLDTAWKGATKRKRVQTRQISIVTTYGGAAMERPGALFWKGATALVLSDLLEEAGYRVQVRALFGATHRTKMALSVLRVKEYDEPANPDMMAVALCHAGFFRSCGYRSYGAAPWFVGHNYGHVEDFSTALWKAIDVGALEKADVEIDEVTTEEQARFQIRGAIAQVEVRDDLSETTQWGV